MACTIERIEPVCIISITGADRLKWLHNFCSNDIKSLVSGTGCEAFVLNVKGKTLSHVIVLANESSLILITLGVPVVSLVNHFDRYIIREDVQIADVSKTTSLWWTAFRTDDQLKNAPWTHARLQSGITSINSSITSPADQLFLVTDNAFDAFNGWASTHNLEPFSESETFYPTRGTFNVARIAAGWPINSTDLTSSNLPQEFGRDQQAISFTKGCYLGQETVARLDAMGHVNQRLVVLKTLANPDNLVGAELFAAGKPEKAVGKITSSALRQPGETIAIAMIRVNALMNDTHLQTAAGEIVWVIPSRS